MRKLIIVLFLLLPSYAMAQSAAAASIGASGKEVLKVEENTKPVIIPNAKRQEWAIISLQLENAKLKAEAAVPAEIKKAVKDANDALDAFWKGIGVNPAELATKWDISDGQNGDIILTPKAEKKIEEKPKAP